MEKSTQSQANWLLILKKTWGYDMGKWDQYETKDTASKWEQYATPEEKWSSYSSKDNKNSSFLNKLKNAYLVAETPAAINRASILMALGDKTVNPMTATPENTPSFRSKFVPSGLDNFLNSTTGTGLRAGIPPVELLNQVLSAPDMVVDPLQMAVGALIGKVAPKIKFGRGASKVKAPKISPETEMELNVRDLSEGIKKDSSRQQYFGKRIKELPREQSNQIENISSNAKRVIDAKKEDAFLNAKKDWKIRSEKFQIKDDKTASDIIEGTIRDLKLKDTPDARKYQSAGENALLDFRNSFNRAVLSPEVTSVSGETKVSIPNKSRTIADLKNIKNKLWRSAGGESHIEASIMKNWAENTGWDNPLYKQAFENINQAKVLSRGNLSGVARGRIAQDNPTYQEMLRADERFGTNYTKEARKSFEDFSSRKSLLERSKETSSLRKSEASMKSSAYREYLKFLKEKSSQKKKKIAWAAGIGLGALGGGWAKLKHLL